MKTNIKKFKLIKVVVVFNFKPLLSVIKPDFEKWKPRKLENQMLMNISHGFLSTPENRVSGHLNPSEIESTKL